MRIAIVSERGDDDLLIRFVDEVLLLSTDLLQRLPSDPELAEWHSAALITRVRLHQCRDQQPEALRDWSPERLARDPRTRQVIQKYAASV